MADNPEDEKRVKIPKKRPQEGEQVTGIPEGAKGPKFSKKQITNETNRRNAARFGNMTDYWLDNIETFLSPQPAITLLSIKYYSKDIDIVIESAYLI